MTLTEEKTKKENKKEFLKDFYAKKILTDEDNRHYLLLIVSKLLEIDIKELEDDFELVSFETGTSKDVKNSQADLVTLCKYGYTNIEINYDYYLEGELKNMVYLCGLIVKQIHPKDKYTKLKKIYQINLDGYDLGERGKFVSRYKLKDEDNVPRKNETLEIIDVNLDFLRKLDYNQVKELEDDSLEKLLYIFINSDREKLDKLYEGAKIMTKVKEKVYDLNTGIDAYFFYNREEFEKRCIRSKVDEDYRNDKEGFIKRYIQNEIEDAVQEAVQEAQEERLTSAKKMYELGNSIETIVEVFSMTDEEIKTFKDMINVSDKL